MGTTALTSVITAKVATVLRNALVANAAVEGRVYSHRVT
jgi:hypothetical protein